MIGRADVLAAEESIRGYVRRTPLLEVAGPNGSPAWLKCEFLQHTGTFKARGAFNRILAAAQAGELDPRIGVVAASGGNAGMANAYAAAVMGVPATVFVPRSRPPSRSSGCTRTGPPSTRSAMSTPTPTRQPPGSRPTVAPSSATPTTSWRSPQAPA
jgi:threonine dehydratase